MKEFPFAKAILEQTNGGKDIILDYYSDADKSFQNNIKKFKRRVDEKTASSSVKETNEGTWIVCDWGEWDKPKNAIGICMEEDNLTFGEACKKLAKLYNVEYQGFTHTPKPIITKRQKTVEEVSKTYIFNYKDELSKSELAVVAPRLNNLISLRFHLKSVVSYSYVKDNGEVVTTASTDDYPILVYDFGEWQKIYQPKSADKQYRFRYAGGRPKDYIFGLDDVKKLQRKKADKAIKDAGEDTPKDKDLKLDEVIICSGDRDALNVASFGYPVVWLNSETATVTADLYKELSSLSNAIYNLPDIDKTGVKQAVKLGLKFLDIKTIWLPKYLLKTKDWRGNPRKDFLDFVNLKYNESRPGIFIKELKKMIKNALPMRFWDEKWDDKSKMTKYTYNIVHAEHFLQYQGFYRMETPNEKDEYCYIHIDGNEVKRTSPNKIEVFVNTFLENRQLAIPLRNMVKKTPYLKEAMLSKLPMIDIDFVDCNANTQYWFFRDKVVEIKAEGVKVHDKGVLDKMVRDTKVVDHPKDISSKKFKESFEEQHFKIYKDKDGDLTIDILKKDNHFLNYLINTSRIHWRKDLETSFKASQQKEELAYFKKHQFDIAAPNLDSDEIFEQKLHLINKIYALGYLFHKYKNKSKPWFVFGIDNKLSDIGESHGGSGKSLMFDYLKIILKEQFFIPGRSKKAIDSEFLFDGVATSTDYIFIDDMNQYFPFNQFFSDITGSMRVRPLHAKAYNIDFKDSPKMAGTSNFPPANLDPSAERRILFTVNSDYYHHNKDSEYKQTRRVSDDFGGRNLFEDFNEQELNDVFVFWSQCVQFFLSHNEKIDPPMDNVKKRNLMATMGDVFRNWAFVYFGDDSGKLDKLISRDQAFKDYKAVAEGKKSSNSFKKALIAFCEFNNYVFNPIEQEPKDGRIIKRLAPGSKPEECFYIKTMLTPPITPLPNINKQTSEENKPDDMPF